MSEEKDSYYLSIVIINYKTPKLVIDCLNSLASQIPSLPPTKVILVDNDSQDNSVTLILDAIITHGWQDWVQLIESKFNGGFSYGNNVGIKAISANNYLLLNSDTIVREGAIRILLDTLEKYPQAGIISPRLEWLDGEPQISCFRNRSPLNELINSAKTGVITKILNKYNVPLPVSDQIIEVEWTSFACVLIRKEVIEQIGLNDEIYQHGMPWYLSQFEDAQSTDICGESSTHYTKLPTYPQTVDRIYEHFPNLKFIYVMGHPIDRLVSQYIHEWTQRVINIDINQGIYDHPELISYSQYPLQLQPFFDTFGRERILPIFFERLLKYPQTELERIAKFIGYEFSVKWHDLSAVNASQERMRKSEWRDFLVEAPILKQIRKKIIPQGFRDWIKSQWMMKQKPQLTQESKKYLQSILDRDLQKLGQWLGVELNCDNYKQVVQETELYW